MFGNVPFENGCPTFDGTSPSDILVIKIILVLVLVSFQSNHFYFI